MQQGNLKAAIEAMEQTRARVYPLEALRSWREGAARAFLGRALGPKKGRGK